MADVRHSFVPTASSPAARTAKRRSPPVLRAGAAWALVLGAGVLLVRPFLKPAPLGDLTARFSMHRSQFQLLSDMLVAEPSVTSVGADNVREYWLFDGRWSSPRTPGRFLSRSQMLEQVGMPPARYEAYLDLLKSLGAYRAVRSSAPTGRAPRIILHMLPSADGPSPRLVHDPARPPAAGTPLGDGWYAEAEAK
jgi:hypothetical protein